MARSWSTGVEDLHGDDELAERVTAFRREYFAEWVTLLLQARPDLDRRVAHLRVHLGLLMVADLYTNGRLWRNETFQENVAAWSSRCSSARPGRTAPDLFGVFGVTHK